MVIPNDNMDANLVSIEWITTNERKEYERCNDEGLNFVVEEQGVGGYFHLGALPVFDVPYEPSSLRFSVGDRVVINPDDAAQLEETEKAAFKEVKLDFIYLKNILGSMLISYCRL